MTKFSYNSFLIFIILTISSTPFAQEASSPNRNSNPVICQDSFNSSLLVTQSGFVKSFLSLYGVELQLGNQSIWTTDDNLGGQIGYIYDRDPDTGLLSNEPSSTLSVDQFFIGRESFYGSIEIDVLSIGDRSRVPIRFSQAPSRLINFMKHPSQGLVIYDASGIVYQTPPEIASLNSDEILKIFPSEEGSDQFFVETSDGRLISLWLDYSESWPSFRVNSFTIVDKVTNDSGLIQSYRLANYTEFTLEISNYEFQGEKREFVRTREESIEVRYDDLPSSRFFPSSNTIFNGHTGNMTITEYSGQSYLVATHSMGIVYINLETGEFQEKLLNPDISIPVHFLVNNIVDVPDLNLIYIITGNRFGRMINKSDLFDPNEASIQFNRMVPGELGFGSSGLGYLEKYRVEGNIIYGIYQTTYGFQSMSIELRPDEIEDNVTLGAEYLNSQPGLRVIR